MHDLTQGRQQDGKPGHFSMNKKWENKRDQNYSWNAEMWGCGCSSEVDCVASWVNKWSWIGSPTTSKIKEQQQLPKISEHLKCSQNWSEETQCLRIGGKIIRGLKGRGPFGEQLGDTIPSGILCKTIAPLCPGGHCSTLTKEHGSHMG